MRARVSPSTGDVGQKAVFAAAIGVPGARLTELGSLPLGAVGHRLVATRYLIANGKVYITLKSGLVHVLEAQPEFKVLATNDLTADSSGFDGTPAVSNGQLFLRSHAFLYCLQDE